jgi:hypothetical protein
MAFRRDVLRELGGFDDTLDTGAPMPGGGDLDMFYRVIRAGGVLVYEPSYMVFYEHRQSEADLQRQYFSWGLGFMASTPPRMILAEISGGIVGISGEYRRSCKRIAGIRDKVS